MMATNYDGAPKSKTNAIAALKQFWQWVVDRYDIPPIKKWPKLGYLEMSFRETADIPTHTAIFENIRIHEPFKAWLCIKWLGSYIAIRPGEIRGIAEGQVDRQRGVLVIPPPQRKTGEAGAADK